MSNRRFEMFMIRQILVRMRQGDRDREIARSGLMGRKKLGVLRHQAALHCQSASAIDPASAQNICHLWSVITIRKSMD
jgi:hypothetical protein